MTTRSGARLCRSAMPAPLPASRCSSRHDGTPPSAAAPRICRSGHPGERTVGRDDLDAEREQRDRNDLEVRQPERDADDRQAQGHAGHQMPDREPPAEQHDPDDVADHGADPGAPAWLDRPAERPENIARDPECRDAERNRDDQDEADQSGNHVGDRHPQPAEHEPDHIENYPHRPASPFVSQLAPASTLRWLTWAPTSAGPELEGTSVLASQARPSIPSRPTVSPGGSDPTPRTASSTPGMNDDRSMESCLIVRISPCPPSSTSWCASSPASRTECTRTPSRVAPRAPATSDTVASGGGPSSAPALASAIKDAVRVAVPEGASAFAA